MDLKQIIEFHHSFKVTPDRKLARFLEVLPEFYRWVKSNKIKLSKNLIKATYLELVENDKNYDMIYTQDIGRVYRPSVNEWVEARPNHPVLTIEDVPLVLIGTKHEWIMGRL